jgi:hypothetical protein
MAARPSRNGQIMDDGATRMGAKMPPMENPISWVDMISNNWSVLVKKLINKWRWKASGDGTYI